MTRAARLTKTATGIVIGGAWTPPPARMGSHAERIQSALLSQPGTRTTGDYLAAALALQVLRIAEVFGEITVVALFRRHRELGYGRIQSAIGALRCWA